MTELPSSPACERNKRPIWEALQDDLQGPKRVIEIGAGTGEHGRYFCEQNPSLTWQPTDRLENLWMLEAQQKAAELEGFCHPIVLDVNDKTWPDLKSYDAIYTANTLHIMSWSDVECFFQAISKAKEQSLFFIYGPMKYNEEYTSQSNQEFDEFLRARDPNSGIREFFELEMLAQSVGFQLVFDKKMPANNQLLCFKKSISQIK